MAVISYRSWQNRFGGDPAVVGKQVFLNNIGFTIVGVAPPGFDGAMQVGSWFDISVPLALEPGPAVGAIKNAVEQAILDGVIPNEHDAAFDYMMSIKDEILDSVATRGRRR